MTYINFTNPLFFSFLTQRAEEKAKSNSPCIANFWNWTCLHFNLFLVFKDCTAILANISYDFKAFTKPSHWTIILLLPFSDTKEKFFNKLRNHSAK